MARKQADTPTNPERAKSAGPASNGTPAPGDGSLSQQIADDLRDGIISNDELTDAYFAARVAAEMPQSRLACLKLARAMRPNPTIEQIFADARRLLAWVLEIPPAEADPDWLASLNRELAGWREIESDMSKLKAEFFDLRDGLRRDGLPS